MALPPEVSLGQLLDIIRGKKPKPVPARVHKGPSKWWTLSQSKVRHFPMNDLKAFEREWQEWVDSIPRKNRRFLAMLKDIERQREARQRLEQKRAKGREKYRKRHGRIQASSA